jgi:hypothetical protein
MRRGTLGIYLCKILKGTRAPPLATPARIPVNATVARYYPDGMADMRDGAAVTLKIGVGGRRQNANMTGA